VRRAETAQDEVARTIVATLAGRLENAEVRSAARKHAGSLPAYDCVLRGIEHLRGYGADDNRMARELFERAIGLDPSYALAHAYLEADVDAVDISSEALTVAQRNVSDYGLADRINLIRSDLFANLPEKTYDLIISNPPYVTAMAMEELPAEYRHEPVLALAGGDDGLDAVRTIIGHSARFLNPDGVLVVEVGRNREAAEAAFPRLPFTWLATAGSEDSVFLLKRDDLRAAA
jgi:hypothetical protein